MCFETCYVLRPYEAELDEFHPKATRTLFIGNLEKDVTASELRKHFEQFGEIIVSWDSCLMVSFFVIPFSIYRIVSVSVSSHYVA